MRHRNTGRKFNRTSSHRKALMMNLCNALIERELIKTTLAKAKELRRFIEPMVTTSKADSLSGRRLMFSRLRSRASVTKLFNVLGPRYEQRPGGYVRVLKCGFRTGDNAPLAIVEFVGRPHDVDETTDKNTQLKQTDAPKKKSKIATEKQTETKKPSSTSKADTAELKKDSTLAKEKSDSLEDGNDL